jgi:hypothetical protein
VDHPRRRGLRWASALCTRTQENRGLQWTPWKRDTCTTTCDDECGVEKKLHVANCPTQSRSAELDKFNHRRLHGETKTEDCNGFLGNVTRAPPPVMMNAVSKRSCTLPTAPLSQGLLRWTNSTIDVCTVRPRSLSQHVMRQLSDRCLTMQASTRADPGRFVV